MSVEFAQIRIASKSDLLVRGMRGCGWGLIAHCMKKGSVVGWKVGQRERSGDVSFWDWRGETKTKQLHSRSLSKEGQGKNISAQWAGAGGRKGTRR